jgi:hypothetical protein
MLAAVVAVDDGVHRPLPDQPAIERHLVGAVGCGTAGLQCADERVRRHFPSLPFQTVAVS